MNYRLREHSRMSPWLSHCLVHSQKAVIRTCISTSLLSANRDFATAEIHQHAEPSKPQAQTIKYKPAIKPHRNRSNADSAGGGDLKHVNLCKGLHNLNGVLGQHSVLGGTSPGLTELGLPNSHNAYTRRRISANKVVCVLEVLSAKAC